MPLIVQKFGGTSVADIQRIQHVANRVLRTHNQGNDVVVILSAMAGITDHLISLANEAAQAPDRRELDVLLATGEQTTAALLARLRSAGDRLASLQAGGLGRNSRLKPTEDHVDYVFRSGVG